MEQPRVAVLEADVKYIRSLVSDMKIDVRRIEADVRRLDDKLTAKIDSLDSRLTAKINARQLKST